MRKVLLALAVSILAAGSASAADIAARPYTKAPPLEPAYNWTGWYAGVNAGGLWGNDRVNPGTFVTSGFVDFAARSALGQFPAYRLNDGAFIGGGQFGYNWQVSNWVYGLEADFQYVSRDKTQSFAFPAGAFNANTESANQKLDFFGTARGRLGILVAPALLGYVTGGLAYGHTKTSVTTVGVPDGFAGVAVSAASDDWRVGWTVGGGLEYAFAGNWSVKGEYLYYDLGSQNLTLNYTTLAGGAVNTINYRATNTGNIARLGLNYKFGGPIVARY